jgi:hypothetical protein
MHMVQLLLICMMLWRWLRVRQGLGHVHQLCGLRYCSGRERAQLQARYGWKMLIIVMMSTE